MDYHAGVYMGKLRRQEVDPNAVTHRTRGRIEGEQRANFYLNKSCIKKKEHESPKTKKQNNKETARQSNKIKQFNEVQRKKRQSTNQTWENQKSQSKKHIPLGN